MARSPKVKKVSISRDYRILLGLAASAASVLVLATTKMPAYSDDTYQVLGTARHVIKLNGEQGMTRVKPASPDGTGEVAVDARGAVFTIANSRNPSPDAVHNCEYGTQPVNRYPLLIENQDRTAVVGGLFLSDVPQSSEWRASYCNSAGITFQGAPNATVDGVRITGAWDAIRAGRDSPKLQILNSWISNARDDAVEDDFLQSATIRDTLIDGAFQGISVKPRKDAQAPDASDQQLTLSGILLRLREYPYKDERRFGALLKSDARAPRSRLVNSVVAIDYAGGQSYPQFWATSWSKLVDSSNNLFLWLSDEPMPAFLPAPPPSFRVLKGRPAREAWARARTNWINCHPKLARLPSDPKSDPRACTPGTWGGFTD
jgi:hypothetical protein